MNCLQQFSAMAKASVKLHSIQLQQLGRYDFFVTSSSLFACVCVLENLIIEPKFHNQFSITSFLAHVDGEPVSLSSFSLLIIYARVYQQQPLTIFYCPIDQRYFKE